MYTEEHILQNINNLNLDLIVKTQKLSINCLSKIVNYIDLTLILKYQKLTPEFVIEFFINNKNEKSRRESEITIYDIFLYQEHFTEEERNMIKSQW
jgi:hypothetical protein